ncbi:MAG: M48 family metalloprotease [Kaiparowitsia implicata GSE-PSE-MK54-09C]|jgi:predicted Zn-dependent protease|nr:M48 family metalloprotease [Kaiparowitsia implicata GSE-PSE-MK54-09C]
MKRFTRFLVVAGSVVLLLVSAKAVASHEAESRAALLASRPTAPAVASAVVAEIIEKTDEATVDEIGQGAWAIAPTLSNQVGATTEPSSQDREFNSSQVNGAESVNADALDAEIPIGAPQSPAVLTNAVPDEDALTEELPDEESVVPERPIEPQTDSGTETLDEQAVEESTGETLREPVTGEAAVSDLRRQIERRRLLLEGDRLWLSGQQSAAAVLYRQAKDDLTVAKVVEPPPPFSDPALLSPEGRVYWREAEAGIQQNQQSRSTVALELLVEQEPAFLPGHLRYAELLLETDQPAAAVAALERIVGAYRQEPELVMAQVNALAANEQWLDASIAARQFALFYPDHAQAEDFEAIAQAHLDTFRRRLRQQLTGNAIANAITGTLGFALTGGLFGPISTLQTSIALLRGESSVGESAVNSIARQVDLVEDETVNAYVSHMGDRLARLTGRDNFEYEFFVINDNRLNAFALPGGKIFINTGAILSANSEAELAGLMAHELAHTVLSHGFQLVLEANLNSNVFQFLPYGGLATNLSVLSYSRNMEREADEFGTRLIATADYAADGLYNLLTTLDRQMRRPQAISWLSSHPDTVERLGTIATQMTNAGYNRYAYEGVDQHNRIRQRIRQLGSPKRFDQFFSPSSETLEPAP